jgi:hypothetical protein
VLSDAHELDPSHNFELLFHHLVGCMGEPVAAREAAFTTSEGEEALEAQLDASKEADWDPLECDFLLLLRVSDLDGPIAVVFVVVLDQVGVVADVVDRCFVLEDDNRCSEQCLKGACKTADVTQPI